MYLFSHNALTIETRISQRLEKGMMNKWNHYNLTASKYLRILNVWISYLIFEKKVLMLQCAILKGATLVAKVILPCC